MQPQRSVGSKVAQLYLKNFIAHSSSSHCFRRLVGSKEDATLISVLLCLCRHRVTGIELPTRPWTTFDDKRSWDAGKQQKSWDAGRVRTGAKRARTEVDASLFFLATKIATTLWLGLLSLNCLTVVLKRHDSTPAFGFVVEF